MRIVRLLSVFVLIAIACFIFNAAPSSAGAPPQEAAPKTVDFASLDREAAPCQDFYRYACGGWMAHNPIPPDQSRWGRFNELLDRNQEVLHQILEKAAATSSNRSELERKIGDYYASCMDEQAINAKRLAAIKPELDRIAAIKSKSELAAEVAHLHNLGVRTFFRFGAEQDFKDAQHMIASVDQGGLSLPSREYYVKDDARSKDIRAKYSDHLIRMMGLAGEGGSGGASSAIAVLRIETALAHASLEPVARREPTNVYHKMTKKEFTALAPAFNWDRFLTDVQAPPVESLNVAVPDFVKAMQEVIQANALEDLKAYMRWHLLHTAAPLLSSDIVNEDFSFFGKVLSGTKELRPRWKRCVTYTDRDLGELLGQPYVDQTFGPDAKERTLAMVREIEAMMEQDIQSLDWMTDTTKKQALVKLHAVANKIGYPDHWRDYSRLNIVRGDAVGNLMRSAEFDLHRRLARIGKNVDKSEWGMTPPTVNAYYSPLQNNINFPAGILQPPFYDKTRDDAVNYGGVGAVVGHELTHGFDDEGRKFDPDGNLRDWWTAEDGREFEKRAQCLVDEYSSFSPVEDVHVNGKLTLGENTADNGGLRLAYRALMKKLGERAGEKVGDFTPAQLMFLGYGQIWCQLARPESSRQLALTDPHSPGEFRVNGVVRNMPEFREAFGCKVGQPMAPQNACRVW